ncbi:MAG TPA: OmpH family outer membrane protein [Puia sp.]|nr:OmpH family outer membrane protein [Puia sp.]
MQKTVLSLLLIGGLLVAGLHTVAQNPTSKLGCISFNELLTAMPEFKKADTLLEAYRVTLEQQFDALKTEYNEQLTVVTGPDSAKFTKPQLNLKKQNLTELIAKIQGFDQQAGVMLNQKRSSLLEPIQKKAEDAIQAVSKDNGYAFVFEKDNLHVYPPSTDILPLVKKKLGLL